MNNATSFKPGLGKLAVKKEVQPGVTDAGIIFKPKEDAGHFIATILFLGETKILPSGIKEQYNLHVGQKILVNRRHPYHEIGDYIIIEYESILGVFDE